MNEAVVKSPQELMESRKKACIAEFEVLKDNVTFKSERKRLTWRGQCYSTYCELTNEMGSRIWPMWESYLAKMFTKQWTNYHILRQRFSVSLVWQPRQCQDTI